MKYISCIIVLVFFVGCETKEQANIAIETREEKMSISSLNKKLMGKTSEEVLSLLGSPNKKSSWDSAVVSPEMSDAKKEKFRNESLGIIWIYSEFYVSFNLNDKVAHIEIEKEGD